MRQITTKEKCIYAIIVFGPTSGNSGFYVADDEEPTHDLARAAKYDTIGDAQYDVTYCRETWEDAHFLIVEVG